MSVRYAKVDDAEAIVKINVEAWKVSYKGLIADSILDERKVDEKTILSIQQKVLNQEAIVLVYEDKEVLGFLTAGSARDEIDIKNELRSIYVRPDAQHKGIGTKLLDRYKQMMKGRRFYLYTLKNNAKSRGFYEKNGGIVCEEFNRSITIDNELIEEVCYVFEP